MTETVAPRTERLAAWSALLSPPHAEPRRRAWLARFGALVAIVAMASYLTWRAVFTIPDSGASQVAGWALWTFEALPICGLVLRLFTLWRLDADAPPRAGPEESFPPTVVFVPTYNEPAAVLAPTVAAACQLEPAHETWVLDDGDRPWVRAMCEEYGARYVQRAEHEHAKAGNINHALAMLAAEHNPAEIIAVLDCDHVPLPGFLTETLGWFDDPDVALVQAPQAYFNESAFDGDGYAGEQGVFFHALMVSRSGPRADPPWCGSTSLVRRTAIEQVGGIAHETITEDLHTTLKLLKLGWRSVYHHQILAVGLAPDTPEQYLIQRRRWALGAMQVFVEERLWKPKRWLTPRNHLEYLMSAFWWFEGAFTAFGLLVPLVILTTGVEAVHADPRLYAVLVTIQVSLRLLGANLLFRGLIRWRHALELRVLRIPVGLQSLWWLLTRRELAFEVTPKGATEDRRWGHAPLILIVLARILGIALVYAALTLFIDLPWPSSTSATLTGGVWLLWGEVIMLLGIARIRDPDFRTSRRVAHRFNVPATLDVEGRRGRLVDISTTGIAVLFDDAAPSGPVTVRLPGGRPFRMQTVRAVGRRAAYQVADDDHAGIAVLTDWIFRTPADPGHGVPDGLPAAAVMGETLAEKRDPPDAPARRNDIQGMRAVAVGLVVASHLGLSAVAGGFIGVDVFFVISGFLITGLMLREHQIDGRIGMRDFYARRAQRILPAALVVSAAILVATGVLQSSVRVRQYAEDALWSAAFVQNLHLIDQATDYFADVTASPFQHYWSLAVEEQFYLVWPLLLILLLRAVRPSWIVGVLGTLSLLSLAASVVLTATRPADAYFSTYTRAFELGLGALLALVIVQMPGALRLPRWFAWVGGTVGIAAIGVSAVLMSSHGFPGWQALVPTLGAVLLLAAGLQRQVGVNWLLGLAPLRWLGDISYSLYLWHFPVIVLGRPQLPVDWSPLTGNLVLLGISVLAADLTYRLVEYPLLRRRRTTFRGLRPLAWWPVTAVTVVAVAFASFGYADHREAQARADAEQWYADHAGLCALAPTEAGSRPDLDRIRDELACSHALADAGAPVPPAIEPRRIAADGFEDGDFCWAEQDVEITACPDAIDPRRPTMVALGDSHLGQWLPALQQIADRRGYNLMPFMRVGCPVWDLPTFAGGENGESPECGDYRDRSRAEIAEVDADLVVLASITDVGVGEDTWGNAEKWSDAVAGALPALAGLAPSVVLLSDTPLREAMSVPSTPECLATAGHGLADCELALPGQFFDAAQWVRDEAEDVGIAEVDVQPLICVERFCPAVAGDIGIYSDESHVSLTWSNHVAGALETMLDSAVGLEH